MGLGNPGEAYKNNRHNIGFSVVSELCKELCVPLQNAPRLKSKIARHKNRFFFLQPQTFMNLSGEAVILAKNFYKIDEIFVIHDEVDLPFGTVRFKNSGGSGGHNGLKSVISCVGEDFFRLRFGIGKFSENLTPDPKNPLKMPVNSHVLSDFENKNALNFLKNHCILALKTFIEREDFAFLGNNFTLRGENF